MVAIIYLDKLTFVITFVIVIIFIYGTNISKPHSINREHSYD